MRQLLCTLLIILLIFSFCACGKPTTKAPPLENVPSEIHSASSLTVSEVSDSVEAMMLGYHLIVKTSSGYTSSIADAPTALQAHDSVPALNIQPTPFSHRAPFEAALIFSVVPESVRVRCWEKSLWTDDDAENKAETLTATKDPDGSFTVKLKEGEYLYEVYVQWPSAAELSGSAFYTFKSTSAIYE